MKTDAGSTPSSRKPLAVGGDQGPKVTPSGRARTGPNRSLTERGTVAARYGSGVALGPSHPPSTSATRPRKAFIVLIASVLATLAFAATSASAARPYESQITEANGEPFANPRGLATDGSAGPTPNTKEAR